MYLFFIVNQQNPNMFLCFCNYLNRFYFLSSTGIINEDTPQSSKEENKLNWTDSKSKHDKKC